VKYLAKQLRDEQRVHQDSNLMMPNIATERDYSLERTAKGSRSALLALLSIVLGKTWDIWLMSC
jgi:hypothetical protein